MYPQKKNLKMDEIKFTLGFCEPIVSDEIFNSPKLDDQQLFKDLMIERNCYNFCGWPKCDHQIELGKEVPTEPIFCSAECRNKYIKRFSKKDEEEIPRYSPIPLGPVVQKFEEQRPPKKIQQYLPAEVEVQYCRVGPYRDVLNEIESWVGGLVVHPKNGMNSQQEKLFELVNENLDQIGVGLKKTDNVVYFFVNVKVRNLDLLTTSDTLFKAAFSFAFFEIMTGQDMQEHITRIKFPYNVYDDLKSILDVIPPQPEVFSSRKVND